MLPGSIIIPDVVSLLNITASVMTAPVLPLILTVVGIDVCLYDAAVIPIS